MSRLGIGIIAVLAGCFSDVGGNALGGSDESSSGESSSGGVSISSTTWGTTSDATSSEGSSSEADGESSVVGPEDSSSETTLSDMSSSTETSTGSTGSTDDGMPPPDLPAEPSDCCVEHAYAGCDDPLIEDAVCDSLPECCAVGPWGWSCKNQAQNTGLCS